MGPDQCEGCKELIKLEGSFNTGMVKVAGALKGIKGKVTLIIFLIVTTLGFQGWTFLQLLDFQKDHNVVQRVNEKNMAEIDKRVAVLEYGLKP